MTNELPSWKILPVIITAKQSSFALAVKIEYFLSVSPSPSS
jgi:hypothetical protein